MKCLKGWFPLFLESLKVFMEGVLIFTAQVLCILGPLALAAYSGSFIPLILYGITMPVGLALIIQFSKPDDDKDDYNNEEKGLQ